MQINQSKYRNNLPQLSSNIFMSDGGCETTLIYHEHFDLPDFASFVLLDKEEGYQALWKYYSTYAELARKYKVGITLESVSWRTNHDWGKKLGYSVDALAEADRKAIKLLCDIRDRYETPTTPIVISACVGPRGDGYQATSFMSPKEAEEYHSVQVKVLSETAADFITAMTMNYVEETIGIVNAAKKANMSVVVSFTLETDGKLPSGQSLKEAIEVIDRETNKGPLYYMINCVHPVHFKDILAPDEDWTQRIKGLKANSSRKSHAELDECGTLDDGDPKDLAQEYGKLVERLKNMSVLGGGCGTDHRHVEEIIKTCISIKK